MWKNHSHWITNRLDKSNDSINTTRPHNTFRTIHERFLYYKILEPRLKKEWVSLSALYDISNE